MVQQEEEVFARDARNTELIPVPVVCVEMTKAMLFYCYLVRDFSFIIECSMESMAGKQDLLLLLPCCR